jgi:predicted O-methyltransferase YrrM
VKIVYLPNDMDAPGFYRCLSPARQLSEHGHTVRLPKYTSTQQIEWRPYIDHFGDKIMDDDGEPYCYPYEKIKNTFTIDLDLPESADVYVLAQRKERMWAEDATHRLRVMGACVVADVDDAYVNLPEYNPAFYGTHPYKRDDGVIVNRAARRNIRRKVGSMPDINKYNWKHMLTHLSQTDLLTVSTPALAEMYAPYAPNIKVIRNYVDWDIWSDITPQYEVERDRIRIGYLASFAYRRGDLQVLRNVLPRFLRDHPEVDFVTNNYETHVYLDVPLKQRITIGEYIFQSLEGDLPLGRMTAVCDIGLVPLAMNEMNECKSHLKGMEYNAAGIPFIASPTESYKDYWCETGTNGFLAYNDDDWYTRMEYLAYNHTARKMMGGMGRDKARAHSIQQNWREWDDALQEVVGGAGHDVARRSIGIGAVQKVSELGPLVDLVADRQPKTIVEIGTARGGTLWSFAQVAPEDATIVSIDIPSGSAMDVRDGKDVYIGRDRKRLKHFVRGEQQLHLIDMNSQLPATKGVLMQALDGKQIDLLFIDGDHSYKGVKSDFDMYAPLVSPGGMIVFHDINKHSDKRVGVNIFWDEIKKRHQRTVEFIGKETWGFMPWGGIGVLFV